ncbi:MAG TPA: c-type cytochrome [Acidimicrobiia bacterium]|jgi:cytochrome c2
MTMGSRVRVLLSTCVVLVAGALLTTACHSSPESQVRIVSGGSAEVGKKLIEHYGCGSCHEIPGVRGASGLVGPPLEKFSKRGYIAGLLRNTADNLTTWISDPKRVEPRTDMPDLGVTPEQARNITAYLYTLR